MSKQGEASVAITAAGYVPCRREDVPDGIRFDIEGNGNGHIVQVAYGTFGRAEGGEGDPYMRIHDRSDGTTDYFRWVPAEFPASLIALEKRLDRKHKAAIEAPGTFGDLCRAIGLDLDDMRRLTRETGENVSATLALAWVQSGRPEVRSRRRVGTEFSGG